MDKQNNDNLMPERRKCKNDVTDVKNMMLKLNNKLKFPIDYTHLISMIDVLVQRCKGIRACSPSHLEWMTPALEKKAFG